MEQKFFYLTIFLYSCPIFIHAFISHEQTFKENMSGTIADALNEEGINLHNQEKYAEAIAKFQAAQFHCPSNKIVDLNMYKNNEARSLNKQGSRLFHKEDYIGAAEKYSAAYETCTNDNSEKQSFKDDMNNAELLVSLLRLLEANSLNQQFNKLFNKEDYTGDAEKYSAAYEAYTNDNSEKQTFEDKMNHAGVIGTLLRQLKANSFIHQGKNLFNKEDYTGAAEKYSAAYEICGNEQLELKQKLRDKINYAKALSHNEEGVKLYNQEKYTEAIAEFQAAYSQCPSHETDTLNAFKNNEADLLNDLNNQGMQLLKKNDYTGAAEKFSAAYKISTNDIDKQSLRDYINFAKALSHNEEGIKLCKQEKYAEAIVKFQAAYSQYPSHETDTLNLFKNSANSLNNQGYKIFYKTDYIGAAEKYSMAFEICTIENYYKQAFKDNINYAKSLAHNEEGVKLHNQEKYAEAIPEFQAAYSQSHRTVNLNTFKNNEARSLNKQGDTLSII